MNRTAKRAALLLLLPLIAFCTSVVSEDGPSGILTGRVSIGPICPVEREGEPCPVPPDLYAGVEVVVESLATGRLVAREALDAQGRYRMELPAGSYRVELEHRLGIDRGASERPRIARVEPSETTVLDFEIDTGIR